ncbi:hypothetical protein B0H14DRAFT_3855847, partial [Mycena olivaceomarginata]
MPDVKSDLKETDKAGNPHGRPSPQTLSPADVTSGLSVADVFAYPRNNVVISRTWGGLKLNHVIVDPNVQMPKSLLQRSYLTSIYDLPATNLTLSVTFGTIEADVEVRPFAAGTAHAASPTSYVARDYERKPHQVHLKFGSITGNATFRVYAPSTVRIFMETSVTFGQTRMYLPRTFHGPLKISSWARAPRLSAELRNACILIDRGRLHNALLRWKCRRMGGQRRAWRQRKGDNGIRVCVGWLCRGGRGRRSRIEREAGALGQELAGPVFPALHNLLDPGTAVEADLCDILVHVLKLRTLALYRLYLCPFPYKKLWNSGRTGVRYLFCTTSAGSQCLPSQIFWKLTSRGFECRYSFLLKC